MLASRIAYVCFWLPLSAVHITAVIAMLNDNLGVCLPYWSSCYSISATGRQFPEFFVFKALLLPTAVFKAAYWCLLYVWTSKVIRKADINYSGLISQQNTEQDSKHKRHSKPKVFLVLGLLASLALIIYTVTLGSGDAYSLARRIGVVFYFALTAFAHLLLLKSLDKLDTEALGIVDQQNRILVICVFLITTAIASAFAGIFWSGWEQWENAYEWWFSLFMISLIWQVAKMWDIIAFNIAFKLD